MMPEPQIPVTPVPASASAAAKPSSSDQASTPMTRKRGSRVVRSMRTRSIALAERKAALNKAPVYMYFFAWDTVGFGGKYKALHMAEIPFVFDNIANAEAMTHKRPEAQALADKMSNAWIAFAKTGSPATKDLPQWTPYSADHRATMIFDNDRRVVNDPRSAMRKYFGANPALTTAGDD